MKTYGYCRVSTTHQSEDGESLGVQQRQIQAYADMRGLTVDRVFVDGAVSGGKPLHKRPQGGEMLAAIKSGDHVIITKVDRMGRGASDSLTVCEDFIKRDISLHIIQLGDDVTKGMMATAMFQIWSVFAELERKQIQTRIREVKRDQKKRGRFLGGSRPFGFQSIDGKLTPVPEEQPIVQRILDLHSAGLSLRAISSQIGGRLSHQGVSRVIRDNTQLKTA